MKKLSQYLVFSLLMLNFLTGCDEPVADYMDIQGRSGMFSELKGKWLVINYWANWCKPCIEEIPELNRFAKNNQKKVTVFAVNFDGVSGTDLVQQAKKLGIQFPVLTQDPSVKLNYPLPTVLPTTLVFNPKGELQETLIGPQTEEGLKQIVR